MVVLRQEIVEAVKMVIRQVVKNRLVECEAMIPDYDPALRWVSLERPTYMSLFFSVWANRCDR